VVSEIREERNIKTREGEKETGRKDERQTGRKIQKAGESKKRGDKQKRTRQETIEAAKD
jgi:hypothetical protein